MSYYPERPKVTWRMTRRLINQDMAAYSEWPRAFGIFPSQRPWIWQFFYVAFTTQMFRAVYLFRLQVYCQDRGWRLLATCLSRFNHTIYGVTIGSEVRSYGALYLAHGHVVMDGHITLAHNVEVAPFVTLGLTNSARRPFDLKGPTIGENVNIGTGAKILGPITIGENVKVGANAVVLDDVPANHTAVGIPARSFPSEPAPGWVQQEEGADGG